LPVTSTNNENNKMEVINLTKADFLAKVANYETNPSEWKYLGDKPAIIDFYADWCGPCRAVAPVLEELAKEYKGQIYVYKIDTEKEQELAAVFNIRSIPSLLFVPIDALQSSYDRCGIDECKVICRSNKQAVRYNLGIRSRIFYKEEELSTGDLLLVAKNNYFWSQPYKEIPFIANGDLIEVRRVRKITELYGFRFADLEVRFPETDWEMEVKVILDSLVSEAPALDQAAQQKLYEAVLLDYADVRSKKALYAKLRVDPWFNALQVKYGYAMTCHKAQGGQWKEIFLDQGWVTPEMLGAEYYRWLYTALTRAVERIYLVNFKDEYLINRD
jgi:thioredoxin